MRTSAAIVGYVKPDGSVVCGWNFNDSMGLLPLLKREFCNIHDLSELLHLGAWDYITGPRGLASTKAYEGPNRSVIRVGRCFVVKNRSMNAQNYLVYSGVDVRIWENCFIYRSISDAIIASSGNAYLFNPIENQWKKFSKKSSVFFKLESMKPIEMLRNFSKI